MIRVETRTGSAIDDALLDGVARLRIAVFREFPYLYDGDMGYERAYLASYRSSPGAVIVAAFDGDQVVGAATGTPLSDHDADFLRAFDGTGYEPAQVFYCAESVLLPAWRGQGLGHKFFDGREAHARSLGFRYSAFCAVIRPENHPARPAGYRALDGFWQARGYQILPGAQAQFSWKDIGEPVDSVKRLQFRIRAL